MRDFFLFRNRKHTENLYVRETGGKNMKNLMTGMVIGALLGGVVGTMASDEINDFTRMVMKKGKKIMKKF